MKLLCMAFDGESKLERAEFKTVEEVWEYSGDLGSKWYFYPFHFAVTNSGLTIKDAPFPLQHLQGKRVDTVERLFEKLSKEEEAQGMDAEAFAFFVSNSYF